MKIRKGDTVKILYGRDASKTGEVFIAMKKAAKVVVKGLNKVKRSIKGDGQTKKSEIVEVERAIYIAKVMLVCPNCGKATRVAMKKDGKNMVRVCKKCGKNIDSEKKIEKVAKVEKVEEKKKVVKSKVKKSK